MAIFHVGKCGLTELPKTYSSWLACIANVVRRIGGGSGGGRVGPPGASVPFGVKVGGLWQDRSRFSTHAPARRRPDTRRHGTWSSLHVFGPMKPIQIPCRYSVRAAIAASLCHGDAALQRTALQLGMSPRSLQRHLAGMGTSYSDMVAEVRLDTACYLLLESNERISEIALRLGYAGTSSFSRVFMRLTKMQPVIYRRQRAVQGNDKSRPGKDAACGQSAETVAIGAKWQDIFPAKRE